jgi:hypothetical protein
MVSVEMFPPGNSHRPGPVGATFVSKSGTVESLHFGETKSAYRSVVTRVDDGSVHGVPVHPADVVVLCRNSGV